MRTAWNRLTRAFRQQWLGASIGFLALFVALGGPATAAKLFTGKDIQDRSITERDLSRKTVSKLRGQQGPAGADGAQGATGASGVPGAPGTDGEEGSPDSPTDVLGKLVTVDGSGSGLDADLFDGQSSNVFAQVANVVSDGDAAGGDLNGSTYPNPQLAADSVAKPEIATDGVGAAEIQAGQVQNAELASTAVSLGKMNSGGSQLLFFNPPSTPADTCVPHIVVVNGPDRGEVLLFEATDDTPGGFFMLPATVPQDNILSLVICNSGGTDDPAGGNYVVHRIGP